MDKAVLVDEEVLGYFKLEGEARLSAQLKRNGLTSEGTPTVRQNGQ